MGKKRGRKITRLPLAKHGKMFIVMAARKHGKSTWALRLARRRAK